MKKINTYLFILVCLLPVTSFAQQEDITGMWYGQITINDTQTVSLPYEIAVSESKGRLTGYSRIVFHANGKDEAGVQNISIRREGNKIIMEDEGFIDHNFSVSPTKNVKKTVIAELTTTDSEMILEGSWSTNRTRTYKSYQGVIVLKRKIEFKKLELFKSLDTLKLVSKLSFKDRPETVAEVAAKPVEKKPEPVQIVPAPAAESLAKTKNTEPSTAKISPPKEKELPKDTLAMTVNKPVVKPAPVAPKQAPVVVVANPPKQEQKTPPPPKPEPEKKVESVAVQPPPKPAPPPVTIVEPSIAKGAAEIEKRITKSDQSFYFETDSLLLTLYDNGEVDGDTVTVLMNGNIIFSKVGLTTKANSKTIYIPSNTDSVNLVMYAESLGSIPPNSGLMVVTDGEKRYDVRFSADLKTNSGIIFRRKRKE